MAVEIFPRVGVGGQGLHGQPVLLQHMPVPFLQPGPVEEAPDIGLPAAHLAVAPEEAGRGLFVDWCDVEDDAEIAARPAGRRIGNLQADRLEIPVVPLAPVEIEILLAGLLEDEAGLRCRGSGIPPACCPAASNGRSCAGRRRASGPYCCRSGSGGGSAIRCNRGSPHRRRPSAARAGRRRPAGRPDRRRTTRRPRRGAQGPGSCAPRACRPGCSQARPAPPPPCRRRGSARRDRRRPSR